MSDSSTSLKDEILLAVSISFGALFFATAITLIIARYYKKIRACCESCLPSKNNNNNNNNKIGSKSPEKRKDAVGVMQFARNYSPAFLQSSEDEFIIPGGFYAKSIQPQLKVTPLTENNISSRPLTPNSITSPFHNRRFTDSVSSLPANFSPEAARTLLSADAVSDEDTASFNSDVKESLSIDDMASLHLKPELYDISRQRTMGVGSLGKVYLSLQYESSSRKKLDVTLKKLTKLQSTRPGMIKIYASVILLPEREVIYTTTHQKMSSMAVFEEMFVFASKPMNRDFDSKTVLVLVHYVDKSGKDIVYGEARLPLLCKEIYSQIPTDVTINIKVASTQVTNYFFLYHVVFYCSADSYQANNNTYLYKVGGFS